MSASKQLFRILGARLESDAAPSAQATGVQSLTTACIVQVDRIVPDPEQPRREFDAEELDRLAGSLRDHGQTDPVKLRWVAGRGSWQIIDGERRWRAAQQIGLKTLTAIIDSRDLTPDQILALQITENALRLDLTAIESGAAYKSLMAAWGCDQQQLAERLHVSPSKVSRCLKALTLPPEVQDAIVAGEVGGMAAVKAHARKPSAGRRKRQAKSATIDTPAGRIVVTPKSGRTIEEVLTAAIDLRRRDAA